MLEKYIIDPKSIGRLDVGTETIIDKSKSVKTMLMTLFAASGNTDIEGIDSKNACYGGTAGLFNAVNWIESSSWDGRDAIVVAADIAIYAAGPARPVGGAGAIAFLIGPNAPIAIGAAHGTHMSNDWDFYKPDLSSEYPQVDGPETLQTYLGSLDKAYDAYRKKVATFAARQADASAASDTQVNGTALSKTSLDDFDYAILHSPYSKLVQKGFGRFLYNDYLSDPKNEKYASIPENFAQLDRKSTITNKDVEKAFAAYGKDAIAKKLEPTMDVVRRVGNMYTASLYGGLASLISNVSPSELKGKKILMYSFGSGSAASVFSFTVVGDTSELAEKLNLKKRLDSMQTVPCQTYVESLKTREAMHSAKDATPTGSIDSLFEGAYYLEKVDHMFRRTYGRKAVA